MSVLEAHNVSIGYMKGNFQNIGLKEYVMRKIKGTYHAEYFWADWDVSFVLENGDLLGIIGTNGAGKSTLLKAVSGVMEPTHGYITHTGVVPLCWNWAVVLMLICLSGKTLFSAALSLAIPAVL